MLIGVELGGKGILMNQLVVVRHFMVADYFFQAVIFFSDYPDVRGVGNIFCTGHSGE